MASITHNGRCGMCTTAPVKASVISIIVALVLVVSSTTATSSGTHQQQAPVVSDHESYFVSIGIDGDCEASIRELHALHKPPPHSWYPVPQASSTSSSSSSSVGAKEPGLPHELKDLDASMPIPDSSSTPPSALKWRYLIVAHGGDGSKVAHPFLDPRFVRLHGPGHEDDDDDDDENETAGHDAEMKLPSAAEHVWLPKNTERFDLYCQNTSSKMRFNTPKNAGAEKRRFSTLEEEQDPSIDVSTIQMAGPPSTQINIVFLAGGFTADEKSKFLKNVTDLTYLMADPAMHPRDPTQDEDGSPAANMHRSVPFNRYWSFFNVYAVFQASKESGASRPKVGLTVDNNMKCQHPAGMERAPFCDRDLAVSLADVSPAEAKADPGRTVIISIINTPLYGGSGIYIEDKLHLGNFFNGYDLNDDFQKNKMLSLVDHELGHAFGNLADEYNIGSSEPEDRPLLNCQIGDGPNPPASPRWKHWIDTFNGATDFTTEYGNGIVPDEKTPWGILPTPAPICGFTNYFKPAANCMMYKLTHYFMCPVCREKSTVTLMRNKFLYTWPRYPLEDTITLVPVNPPAQGSNKYPILSANTTLILHLPVALSHGSFTVTWTDSDGSVIAPDAKYECPVCVAITPAMFAKYPINEVVEITASVVDNTVFLSQDPTVKDAVKHQVTQTTKFQIRVSNDVDVQNNVTLEEGARRNSVGIHEHDLQMVYTQCPPNANNGTPVCSLNFTNKAYKAPPPLEDLSQYDDWVFVVMGGVAVFFLLLWMFAANKYGDRSNGVVRPIFTTEFTCFISLVRKIMLFSAVCFMFASLGAMGLATYYYTQSSAIGKYIIIAGVSLAVGLYILAFVGFWSVSSRSKRMLLINGLLMLIACAILVAVGILANQIGTQIKEDDSDWTKRLEGWWKDIVQDTPDRACAIQQWLECTGFLEPCTTVVGSSLYCPKNCDDINYRYPAPCRAVIQEAINSNYDTIILIVGSSGGLVLGGIVLNFILFGALMKMKSDIRNQVHKRVHKTASMHNGGNPAKKPHDSHRALFLLQSLDVSDTKKLLREFKRIDIDGNGELDRTELFIFFKKALCYKPTKEEIEVIMKIGDLDGDGTISIREFLNIFGKGQGGGGGGADAPLKSAESSRRMQERLTQQGFNGGGGGGPRSSAGAPGGGGQGVLSVPQQQPAQRGQAVHHQQQQQQRPQQNDIMDDCL